MTVGFSHTFKDILGPSTSLLTLDFYIHSTRMKAKTEIPYIIQLSR